MDSRKISRDSAVFFDHAEIADLWQMIGEGEDIDTPETIEFQRPDGTVVRYVLAADALPEDLGCAQAQNAVQTNRPL